MEREGCSDSAAPRLGRDDVLSMERLYNPKIYTSGTPLNAMLRHSTSSQPRDPPFYPL
jgi:hypothetical protein